MIMNIKSSFLNCNTITEYLGKDKKFKANNFLCTASLTTFLTLQYSSLKNKKHMINRKLIWLN